MRALLIALLVVPAAANNRAGEANAPAAPTPAPSARPATGPQIQTQVRGGGIDARVTAPGAVGVNPGASAVPPAGAADAEVRPQVEGQSEARPASSSARPELHGAAQDPGAAMMKEGAAAALGRTQTAVKAGAAVKDDAATLGALDKQYDKAEIRRGFAPEGGWPSVGARDTGVSGRVEHLTRQGDANVPDSPANALGLYRSAVKLAMDAFKGKALSSAEAESLTAKVVEHARARTESVKAADSERVVPGALERYVAQAYEAAQRGDAKAAAKILDRDVPEWQAFVGAAARPADLQAVREDVQRVLDKQAHPAKVRFRFQDGVFAAVGLPERGAAAPGARVVSVPASLPGSFSMKENSAAAPPSASEAETRPRGVLASAARKARREGALAGASYLFSVLARAGYDAVFAKGLSEKNLAAVSRGEESGVLSLDLGPLASPSAANAEAVAAFHKKLTGSSVAVEAVARARAAETKAAPAERAALASADLPGGAAYYARLFAQASLDRLDDEAAHAARKRGAKALAYADRGLARLVAVDGTPAKAAAVAALGFQTELKGSELRAWREGPQASRGLADALAFLNGRAAEAAVDAAVVARAVEAAEAKPQSRLPLRLSDLPPLRPAGLVRTARGSRWVEIGKDVIALFEPGSRRFEGAYPLAAAR